MLCSLYIFYQFLAIKISPLWVFRCCLFCLTIAWKGLCKQFFFKLFNHFVFTRASWKQHVAKFGAVFIPFPKLGVESEVLIIYIYCHNWHFVLVFMALLYKILLMISSSLFCWFWWLEFIHTILRSSASTGTHLQLPEAISHCHFQLYSWCSHPLTYSFNKHLINAHYVPVGARPQESEMSKDGLVKRDTISSSHQKLYK